MGLQDKQVWVGSRRSLRDGGEPSVLCPRYKHVAVTRPSWLCPFLKGFMVGGKLGWIEPLPAERWPLPLSGDLELKAGQVSG